VCFALLTESNGRNLGNDGRNTSNSPGVTPSVAALLRRSVDPVWLAANNLQIDGVGSNGRSTGVLQQLSRDVGGSWGTMQETLRPADAARMFLAKLVVTNDSVYTGWNVTQSGQREWVEVQLSSPIAADVLRVQQPLASEARSSNYGPAHVAEAKALAAQFYKTPTQTWWEQFRTRST
jgi:hypothetical protein